MPSEIFVAYIDRAARLDYIPLLPSLMTSVGQFLTNVRPQERSLNSLNITYCVYSALTVIF